RWSEYSFTPTINAQKRGIGDGRSASSGWAAATPTITTFPIRVHTRKPNRPRTPRIELPSVSLALGSLVDRGRKLEPPGGPASLRDAHCPLASWRLRE